MGAIATRVKNRVITGLKYGGQIPVPAIDAHLAAIFDELYSRTEVARYDLPAIDEVEGTDEYTLPDLAGTPAGFRVCRILSVCRVTYDDDSAIDSRTYLDGSAYDLDAAIGVDGLADSQILTLHVKSPADGTGTLVVRVVASFSDDSFFPSAYARDIELAATSRLFDFLCSEAGKPWADSNRAVLEERKFRGALNRLRSKSLQRATGRSTACRARYPFIV